MSMRTGGNDGNLKTRGFAPLADTWLAGAPLIRAIGLWKMLAWGFLFMLLAGSAALFPGLPDRLYALEHRTFVPLTAASATERPILLLLSPFMINLKRGQRRLLFR